LWGRYPPNDNVHGRDPQCPVNVDSRRRSNVSNAQKAAIPPELSEQAKSTLSAPSRLVL